MSYLTQNKLYLLFFSQAVALVPVFLSLPKWLILFWALTCFWRIQIFRRSLQFPSLALRVLGLLLGLVGLALSFDKLLSIEVFVSFFLVSFSLKAIELHQRADALLLISLNFICLGVGFLFYQNIFISAYAIFALIVCLQAWVALYRHRQYGLFKQFRYSASIVFKALPIMLILFVSMPRLGQLWQMPSQSQTGQTGISDSMSPGEFNRLIQSNEVAFRVSFIEPQAIPSNDQRYWRAIVFDDFDGKRWSRGETWQGLSFGEYAPTSRPNPVWHLQYDKRGVVNYSVLLEPHQTRWLFTLMAPISASSESLTLRFSPNMSLENRFNVAARSEYSVISATTFSHASSGLSELARRRNLAIPAQGNDRSRQYAASLRAKYGDGAEADKNIIRDVLSFYRETFYYTLQPPSIAGDFVDGFLFGSQRGFCEHFSSSFTYLMRASNIPARVVVGYQGGERSPLENYLVIRQRDAHAWAEVWLEGEGWQRVDPTAAVAPSRIEGGLEQAVGAEERAFVGRGFSGAGLAAWLQLRADLLSYNWHRWVLSYGGDAQSDFFKRFLGGADPWRIALFFLGGCVSLLALYFAYAFMPRPLRRRYEESKTYAKHLSRLSQIGFSKQPNESAQQFAERVADARPQWRADLIRIACAYSALAYKPHCRVSQRQFHLMVRRWRP